MHIGNTKLCKHRQPNKPQQLSIHHDSSLLHTALQCTLLNLTFSRQAAVLAEQPHQLTEDYHSALLTCVVHLGDDGGADLLNLLLLVFKLVHLSQLVAIQPLHGLIHSLLNLALVL